MAASPSDTNAFRDMMRSITVSDVMRKDANVLTVSTKDDPVDAFKVRRDAPRRADW